MGRDGDDWMSDGSELQRRDAATGNAQLKSCLIEEWEYFNQMIS